MKSTTIGLILTLSLFAFAQETTLHAVRHDTQLARDEARYGISGLVVDMVTGDPLPKTEVSIALTAGPGVFREESFVESGPDGRFSFPKVKRGKYMLSGSRRGYSLQSFEAHDEFSTAIVTGPELDTEHLLFRLRPDGSIHGQVMDDQNDPVPNATVHLAVVDNRTGQRAMRLAQSSQTDERGEYNIPHLPPGSYYLAIVAKPWYAVAQRSALQPETIDKTSGSLDVAFPITYYPDTADASAARPLKVQPGERVTADFVLRAVPAVRVQSSLQPDELSNLTAEQTPAQSRRFFRSRPLQIRQQLFGSLELPVPVAMESQPDGTIEAVGLAPGEYEVVSETENGPIVKRVDLRTTTTLDGAEASRRTLVRGTVWDDKARKGRTAVVLYSRTTGKIYAALPDEKSKFKINEPVEPGDYELIVNAQDKYVKAVSASGATVRGRTVTLGRSPEVELNMSVSSGTGDVTGVALLAEKSCAAAMVILVPEDPRNNVALFRRDQSDSDGTFTLPNIVPGKYSVLALAGAWDIEWLNADVLQRYNKGATPVTVEASSRQSLTVHVQKVD